LFGTGVVYTGGKFAAVNTRGKLPPGSLTPVANLPPVLLTSVANLPPVSTTLAKLVEKFAAVSLTSVANLPPVSLIPVVRLDLSISPRIFEKI
jgi:hypothetical protein